MEQGEICNKSPTLRLELGQSKTKLFSVSTWGRQKAAIPAWQGFGSERTAEYLNVCWVVWGFFVVGVFLLVVFICCWGFGVFCFALVWFSLVWVFSQKDLCSE